MEIPKNQVKPTYKPNRIPLSERIAYIFFSILIFAYGTAIVIFDDFTVTNRRGGVVIHLHGIPVWVLYGAMLSVVALLISMVLDHYDKRDNEKNYRQFAKIAVILAISLFVLAILLEGFVFQQRT
jgi:cbb3-type cytochrome oxidase subunit 1